MKAENKIYRVAAKEAINEIMNDKYNNWNIFKQQSFNAMLKGWEVRYMINYLAPKTVHKYFRHIMPEDRSEDKKLERLFYQYTAKQIRKIA